ncbi:GCN5-related N-acetyltransferase [Litorimonas sp. WD9-15]|uniref:GCN5-related N-acetyltransferase n=1 Tax=Litorimonas sp. WD9-15 TaxID=3418716 RepID=UPI003CFCFCC4
MTHDPILPFGFEDEDEADIRLAWRELYRTRLPAMAEDRPDWPVYLDHCFARILLDNAVGQFWRNAIEPPAWKNTPLPVLQTAIDLGEAVLSDTADIWDLNDASLKMRNKKPRGREPARRRRPKWTRKY